jgi:hypothetical protein
MSDSDIQGMLLQSLQPCANVVELVHFEQDRFKGHGQTALAEKPKMGELQMDWLRSEDLKEVKVATAPLISLAVIKRVA